MEDATPILVLGDPRLQIRCPVVGERYPELERDLARLTAALAEARARLGFGRAISAPQIGLIRRIIAMDLGAGPFVLIDPEILWRSEETAAVWDDCLSVPGRLVRVRRHHSISLRFRDHALRVRAWSRLPFDLSELVQHELDHLDGILMVDRSDGADAVQLPQPWRMRGRRLSGRFRAGLRHERANYRNRCDAELERIPVQRQGACDVDNCPEVYVPVCSPDGETDDNACQAEAAGVTTFTDLVDQLASEVGGRLDREVVQVVDFWHVIEEARVGSPPA